jgi:hypothetical protein
MAEKWLVWGCVKNEEVSAYVVLCSSIFEFSQTGAKHGHDIPYSLHRLLERRYAFIRHGRCSWDGINCIRASTDFLPHYTRWERSLPKTIGKDSPGWLSTKR